MLSMIDAGPLVDPDGPSRSRIKDMNGICQLEVDG
jgi:hypothetical protein